MPGFIIIGAQRCGTTSLYNYLMQHPDIIPAFTKEVHFFDLNFGKGMNWYRAHFPFPRYRYYVDQIRKRDLISGEASPYYIFHPLVPKRIAEILPRVKLIVMLRNPIDRAYSHYWHEVRLGYETVSFEEAIRWEPERLYSEQQRLLEDEQYRSSHYRHYSYLKRGIYVEQLKAWRTFFSEEQILVLRSEDFYADPATGLGRTFEFLNMVDWELTEFRKYQQATYPQMNPSTRKRLIDFFQRHNERLSSYLGMDLDWDR